MGDRVGIYEILNTVNGKRYIGSAVRLKSRWGAHLCDLRKGAHHSSKLQRAWDKYGEGAFKFLPILTCQKSMLLFYEQQLLDKAKPEYNICKIAGSNLGVKRTAETKRKLSIARAGRIISSETRAKQSASMKGKQNALGKNTGPRTAETKAKISAKHKGKILTAEHREKLSAAHTGKILPPGHKGKLSAALKGKKKSPESIANGIKARTGLKRTAEQRARMSAARLRYLAAQ